MIKYKKKVLLPGLMVVVLVASLVAWRALGGTASSQTAAVRTSTVQRGIVQTTASASGTLTAQKIIGENFKTGGKLADLLVKVGDKVAQGQPLARLDGTDARNSLASAQAGLHSAQARLAQVTQGLSSEETAQVNASADQAQSSVNSAQVALADAKASSDQDATNLQAAVDQASAALATDQSRLNDAQSTLTSDQAASPPSPAKVATDQASVTSLQDKVTQDTNVLTNAKNAQASGRLRDAQSVDSATSGLNSAQHGLTSTLAANAVKTQAPKAADVSIARAGVESSQAQVAAAQKALDDTTLSAPFAGTVVSISNQVGEFVSGGPVQSSSSASSSTASGTSTATPRGLVVIQADLDPWVVASFNETDASNLAVGQPATVTFDARPDLKVGGQVLQVDPSATVVNNVVTYNATISLTNPPATLKPGMSANVSVVVSEKDNALNVPNLAITSSQGTSTVVKMVGTKQLTTEVATGLRGDSRTEITGGLSEGDQIVLPSVRSGSSTSRTTTGTGGAGLRGVGGGGAPFGGGLRG